jgi:hypothetical protein
MPAAGVVYRGPACPHCREPLEVSGLLSGRQACPRCGRPFEAVVFAPPARTRLVPAVPAGEDAASACPVHRGNAAIAACGRCGVFLCGLCRIEADAQVLCPACFGRLSAGGELLLGHHWFRDYDRVASLVVLLGFATVVGGVVTGPAAVYFTARGRRQRLGWGDAPQTGRLAVAIVLGLLNVAVSVGAVAFLLSGP